jgi:hypothetical protein
VDEDHAGALAVQRRDRQQHRQRRERQDEHEREVVLRRQGVRDAEAERQRRDEDQVPPSRLEPQRVRRQ